MNVPETILLSGAYKAILTTEHPASSYGIPVLLVNGEPFGVADMTPVGLTGGELARRFLSWKQSDYPSPDGCVWARQTRATTLPTRKYLGMPTGRPRKTASGAVGFHLTIERAVLAAIRAAALVRGITPSALISECCRARLFTTK